MATASGVLAWGSVAVVASAVQHCYTAWRSAGRLETAWYLLWLVCATSTSVLFFSLTTIGVSRLFAVDAMLAVAGPAAGWSLVITAVSFYACIWLVRRLPSRMPGTMAAQQADAADERRSGACE